MKTVYLADYTVYTQSYLYLSHGRGEVRHGKEWEGGGHFTPKGRKGGMEGRGLGGG